MRVQIRIMDWVFDWLQVLYLSSKLEHPWKQRSPDCFVPRPVHRNSCGKNWCCLDFVSSLRTFWHKVHRLWLSFSSRAPRWSNSPVSPACCWLKIPPSGSSLEQRCHAMAMYFCFETLIFFDFFFIIYELYEWYFIRKSKSFFSELGKYF